MIGGILGAIALTALVFGGLIGFWLRRSDNSLFLSTLIGMVAFVLSALLLFAIFRPYGFVDNYELGYRYNSLTGQIVVSPRTGYIERTPWVETVHTIDLRPRQVCINVGGSSSGQVNQRVLNCKLVSFNPKGLQLFISWHGRGDYSGQLLNDLLMIYAYDPSGRSYSFLNVSDETRPVQGPAPVTGAVATPVVQ